jgi:hypothetical protein
MAYKGAVVTDPTVIDAQSPSARNRIIYQSEALAVGSSQTFLTRVQSINYSFSVGRTDVNQFGELAAIDRVVLEQPTVSMDFSYILHGTANEAALGFVTDGSDSCIARILEGKTASPVVDEQDYFVALAADGVDAAAGTPVNSNIKIPSGFITSYSASGSVGEFPTATINIEALDMQIGSAIIGAETVTASAAGSADSYVLRPGEIDLNIAAFGGTVHLQSFTLTVDMSREPISRLGSNFPFARVISFPLNATLSAEGIISGGDAGSLAKEGDSDNLIDSDTFISSLKVNCQKQSGGTHVDGIMYEMKKAKLDSYSYTSSIGANKAVSMDWSVPIGSAAQDDRGVFITLNGAS